MVNNPKGVRTLDTKLVVTQGGFILGISVWMFVCISVYKITQRVVLLLTNEKMKFRIWRLLESSFLIMRV